MQMTRRVNKLHYDGKRTWLFFLLLDMIWGQLSKWRHNMCVCDVTLCVRLSQSGWNKQGIRDGQLPWTGACDKRCRSVRNLLPFQIFEEVLTVYLQCRERFKKIHITLIFARVYTTVLLGQIPIVKGIEIFKKTITYLQDVRDHTMWFRAFYQTAPKNAFKHYFDLDMSYINCHGDMRSVVFCFKMNLSNHTMYTLK